MFVCLYIYIVCKFETWLSLHSCSTAPLSLGQGAWLELGEGKRLLPVMELVLGEELELEAELPEGGARGCSALAVENEKKLYYTHTLNTKLPPYSVTT